MTEPTGSTAEGTPWEEARGPHLPDRLTRVSIYVWPFVVLAILQAIAIWPEYRPTIFSDPGVLPQVVLSAAIRLSPTLLGAALFLRHPDALRTLPLLVAGVTLLALEQVLGLMRQPVVEAIWVPALDTVESAGALFIATLPSTIYGLIALVIGVVGMWFLARGLQAARQHGHEWSRVLFAAFALLALLMAAYRIGSNLPAIDASYGVAGPVVVAADAAIGLASSLVAGYLIVIAFGAWRAGDRPSMGWALVAFTGAFTLIGSAILVVVGPLPLDFSGISLFLSLLVIAASPLGLLVAFALGLPAESEAAPGSVPVASPEPTPDPPAAMTPGSAGS